MHPSRTSPYEPTTAAGRLDGRTAIVTGGDSGIGRTVAVLSAREGADVAGVYLEEHDDAKGRPAALTHALLTDRRW